MAGTNGSDKDACLSSNLYRFSGNEISVDVWGCFVWLDVGVVSVARESTNLVVGRDSFLMTFG